MEISRRGVLASGALLGVGASGGATAWPIRPALVLLDRSVKAGDRRDARLPAGINRRLGDDLVRQWRDGLEVDVRAHGGAEALVRWDKCLLLAGLAREAGLRSRRTRIGRSLFHLRLTIA